MILIIAHHYGYQGGVDITNAAFAANTVFLQILSLGGKVGVICFVLITGYFMINSHFKFKKLLKLILEILFYSVAIMLIFYLFGFAEFDLKTFLKCLTPVMHSVYWFATVYVALYVLTPFINMLLHHLSQRAYLSLLAILFVIISLIPTFLLGNFGVGNLGCFVFFYMIAAYIRLYPESFHGALMKVKFNLCFALLFACLLIASVFALDMIGPLFHLTMYSSLYFMSMTSTLAILCAVFLFLTFKNLNVKENRFVNLVAGCMFGVYLIHANHFIWPLLHTTIFMNEVYFSSPWLYLQAFVFIYGVLAGCVLIDLLRIYLLEKPLFKLIDRFEEKHADNIVGVKEKFAHFVERLVL